MELVTRDGATLLCAGRPWRFLLLNAYYLADEVGQGQPAHAAEALDAAVQLGARVVRTWAFNDAPWKGSRMYDDLDAPREEGLRALDWTVAEAKRRGLRLILTLADYWPAYGGMAQWLRWRGVRLTDVERGQPQRYAHLFYGDLQLREVYRRRATQLLTRRNVFTGSRYGEEPAIVAWELMNEARGAPPDWVAFAAESIRAEARQLVALGDERAADHDALDLASLHVYPEKHGAKPGEERAWGVAELDRAAAQVTRPLLVGEFGLFGNRLGLEERQGAYDAWFRHAAAIGVAGMGPWLLGYRARPPAWDEHLTFYAGGEYDPVLLEAARRFRGSSNP